MIANDAFHSDPNVHNAIVVHELFHNYMPFYMDFNETQLGWMDEGWTEFLENKFRKGKLTPDVDTSDNVYQR